MTLAIELTPYEEDWLNAEAAQRGVHPADIVRRLLDEQIPIPPSSSEVASTTPDIDAESAAIIAYFDRRLADEALDDPDEIRKAEQDLAEFKRNMNANSVAAGERLVYP